ncbi:hypothetical protein O7598_31195 [Micromonospora sp. WMMC241]|uniref:hypothetical protein n=1 Tax=Micromonospora sp. WMMC241 TaxID=3015159 RepID=UPI0022B6E147|nr:hypothetical protein [Micromonospora sp. WMMC241]MCZ7434798.1 hypothetical protein [Micromonospora sp. WMMC241]MCZ7440853.1 hypothetical protein [Micromonospora sp. WMMC241]MCZ7440892.1 hypothetical protein [Micromonospora sp. WMMC241]
MTGPLDLAAVLAHTGWTVPAPRSELEPRTPTNPMPNTPGPNAWPATAEPTTHLDHWWRNGSNDFPVATDPALAGHNPDAPTATVTPLLPAGVAEDAEIVGRLRFLTREIAHLAGEHRVPADLAQLIDQARRIAHGDLPRTTDTRRAA